MSWLTEIIEQHKKLESPRNFWYWSSLATLSAVVKDQVWLDRGGVYKLYPNIYVMLHADSGLKKGPPVGMAKDLVKRVNNTRIISGRSSIQGILKELGTAYTIPGGTVINKSVGFIVSSEFSSSIVNDPAAMTILTDLYDRQYNEGEYRSLLKMESFNLKDPTITMLVATNEAHFEDFVTGKDIRGGFIGRMFVIAESEVQHLNSLAAPLRNPPDHAKYLPHLKEIAKLKGPFEPIGALEQSEIYKYKKGEDWYTEAGLIYDDWYERFYREVGEATEKDSTGTVQRFGDSVLKVAMLLSLSRSTNMVITVEDITEALEVTEPLIGNVRKATLGKRGKSEYAEKKGMIIKEITERPNYSITRAMLLRKFMMDFKASELDEIMLEFDQIGVITSKSIGNQIVYQMPEEKAKVFINHFKGKIK